MKNGFVSAILPELNFEEVINFASEHAFDSVEIMCWPVTKAKRRYAGVTHIDVTTLNINKAESINDYLRKKNVDISALGYYPNPLESNLEKRRYYISHIKQCILAAEMLGLENFNTFIGKDKTKTIEENLEIFADVWPPIVKFANAHGIKIGIENCPMFYTYDEWPGGNNLASTPSIWRKMFEIIPDNNFGLNYDPSHLIWQQIDYIKPVYEFKDRIFHVHLKDVKIYKDKLKDEGIYAIPLAFHSPKLPGHGDVDFGNFISALNDIKYKGCAVIEVEDRSFEDSIEDRKNAIILSKRYLEQFVI